MSFKRFILKKGKVNYFKYMIMKNMRKTVLLLFISFCLSASSFAEITFIQGDLRVAKERAAREGKLILLDFWASYCTPCRMMEEYTFTNPDVEEYINAHYIPVKVDIQSFDGYDLKNQYKVSVLPTMIVLSSKGGQVGRHEETFSASRLMPVLEKYNLPSNRLKSSIPTVTYNATTGYSNNSSNNTRVMSSTVSKKEKETSTANTPKISKRETTVVATTIHPAKEPIRTVKPTGSPNLAVDGAVFTKAQPNTFAIQVSAYFDESQLKEGVEDVKKDFGGKQKIFVSKRKENGRFVYRILVGQFTSKQSADKYMKSNAINGIVKDFDILK
jgi:thiol-disulfide isomerase/thioredoxin